MPPENVPWNLIVVAVPDVPADAGNVRTQVAVLPCAMSPTDCGIGEPSALPSFAEVNSTPNAVAVPVFLTVTFA